MRGRCQCQPLRLAEAVVAQLLLQASLASKKTLINHNLINKSYSSGCNGLAVRCEGDSSGLGGCCKEGGFELLVLQSILLGTPSSCIHPGDRARSVCSGTAAWCLWRKGISPGFLTAARSPAYFMLQLSLCCFKKKKKEQMLFKASAIKPTLLSGEEAVIDIPCSQVVSAGQAPREGWLL